MLKHLIEKQFWLIGRKQNYVPSILTNIKYLLHLQDSDKKTIMRNNIH